MEDFISVTTAAKKLGLHRETLKRAIRAKKINAKIIGKAYKIALPDLERYIESQQIDTKQLNLRFNRS